MIEYEKRLVEVEEILNHLSKEDYDKIPDDVIERISNQKDKQYFWKFDESKSLQDQNINRDTIAILSYINMEYLLNEEQKEYMQKLHRLNEKSRLENTKNNDDYYKEIFKNTNSNIEKELNEEKNAIIEYKENFFIKIINIIKEYLKKTKN